MKRTDDLPLRTRKFGRAEVPPRRDEGGFTLMEIAIVAIIVGLLSTLAVATVRHLQQRAARSTILNNLRQLHEAKEHYFFDTGLNITTPRGLVTYDYLRTSVGDRVTSGTTFEAHLGWHYGFFLAAGQPTYAYQGRNPGTHVGNNTTGSMSWSQPTGEVIWYPAPPAELATASASSGSAATTAAQPVAQPAAQPAPPAQPTTNPNAPTLTNGKIATYTLATQRNLWFDDARWVRELGVTSPDGSPITVVAVRSDPPDFILTATRRGNYFPVTFTNPGVKSSATFYVTVRNGAGEATLPLKVNMNP
jgi:type II secretory pathway pseudopilin PulG